jgi:amino acid transporter
MAEHGMLPRWFAQLSPRFLTPANSILFYGLVAALLSLWGGFAALAAASTLTRLLTYLITAAALPVIERREGRVNRLHLAVAGLATAATVWIATHATVQSWTMFGALIAVGTVLYVIANLSRTRAIQP